MQDPGTAPGETGGAAGAASNRPVVHREPVHGYRLLIPSGWHRFELDAGVLYVPDPVDLHTSLAVTHADLGTDVRPGDVPALRSGFAAGLRQLPGSRVEMLEAEAVGQVVTMEARQTFHETEFDGRVALRKRWVRLIHRGRTQVRLVAQGSSPRRFDAWEPLFAEAMGTLCFDDQPGGHGSDR